MVKTISKKHNHSKEALKYKICVSGAAVTDHCSKTAVENAEKIGRLIAEHGMVLVTGATTGMPYWAAKGCHEAGGTVIGFSPAASKAAHLRSYHLPTDYHDVIIYTGFDYSGRNLILTRSSDAIITICGRMGTLNEYTIGYEDKKPTGVLLKSGGTADIIAGIIDKTFKTSDRTVFEEDPVRLLDKLIVIIEKEYKN